MATSYRSYFADLPLRRKVLVVSSLTTSLALVVATTAFMAFELMTAPKTMAKTAEAIAAIVAKDAAAALLFEDQAAVGSTLDSLGPAEGIRAAVVYDATGKPFAVRTFGEGEGYAPPAAQAPGTHIDMGRVDVFRAVLSEGKVVGTVYLHMGIEELRAQLGRVGLVALAALFASLAISTLLAARLQRHISEPIAAVRDRLRSIADGEANLADRLQVASRDEVGELARWFNVFVEKLQGLVESVRASTEVLTVSASGLEATSVQMSSAAEETSAEAGSAAEGSRAVSGIVADLVSGTRELAASVRGVDGHAREAAKVARRAVAVATEANGATASLGKRSEEVEKVVSTIGSIAEQTDMLALNAAIEAARAGDAAKGFGVVAREVRRLADESATAAQDVGARIRSIQTGIRGAIETISEIGKVISEVDAIAQAIADAVSAQTKTTEEIERSLFEAASRSSTMAEAMGGVVEAARGTSDGVKEIRSAAKELADMAAQMRLLVGRFTYRKDHAEVRP